ncbi:MAG: hypothetical protein KTR15_13485 [Phycisphaeraceae bacterium]|nr:hypothetical protein [Phycisphaeraceae bacterium]
MAERAATSRRRNGRQRGSAYILVLGITTMLVVMGIGSSLLSRVMLEQSNLEEDVVSVRLAAVSALDVMHKRIDGDTGWRSKFSHDTWGGTEAYGDAEVQFKFVDEADENLADDATQLFRVYARATIGHAVRVYSVELKPDGSGGYTRDARTLRRESNE